MSSHLYRAIDKNLIKPPKWMKDNLHYEVIGGSMSYGVSNDSSDMDIIGWCIPRKDMIFPHLTGHIQGFGHKPETFEQFQMHHVEDKNISKEYDFTIYNVVKFFQLCAENNPNMIDTLYVPNRCVTHISQIGTMVRDNRDKFLHKGSYHKLKGYAYAQLSKLENANINGKKSKKRQETIEKHGMDTKFAYHVVRLVNQAEQILTEGTLDIERSREQLKSVRRGEWSIEQIRTWFDSKERDLSTLYANSNLRHSPDWDFLQSLLMNVLESHYGDISEAVKIVGKEDKILNELENLVNRYR